MDESFFNIVKEKHNRRVKSFDEFFSKYSTEDTTDDVLDLQTMTIVEDKGHLRKKKAAYFGSKQLASSTIIQKYMEELEEEKIKDSLSRESTSSRLRRQKSGSPSWCEDEIQDDETSDLCLDSWPNDQKSSLQVQYMLQSFQACAENIIGDLFDARRPNPEIFKGPTEVSFEKEKCSLKNSLSCGNRLWDITLQVSASDKVPSQDDFYPSSPIEPIFRNVFSTDKNNSFFVNLLRWMKMIPSHTSLVCTTPLKNRSKHPVCHILTVKSKKDTDCAKKEICSARKFPLRNFKAINYSPVKSTLIHLDASTPLGTNDATCAEEKLCSNQKFHSTLKAISYTPVKSTLIHLNASTPLGTDDDCSAKEKLRSNQKCHSENLKAISCSPVKSTSTPLNASNPSDTNDATYATEKLCSSENLHSKNLNTVKSSPVNSTLIHVNASTPSRKRCFIVDDELSILKNKKVCNKSESNSAKSNTSVIEKKSDIGTCTTSSVERLNPVPICDLLKTFDMLPSRKSPKITAAKTRRIQESNVKDLHEKSICILENNPR